MPSNTHNITESWKQAEFLLLNSYISAPHLRHDQAWNQNINTKSQKIVLEPQNESFSCKQNTGN